MTINWARGISLDIETTGLNLYKDSIRLVAVKIGDDEPLVFDFIPKKLEAMLVDPSIVKIIHNAAFDVPFIRLQTGIRIVNVFDTMLAEKLIIGGRFNMSASLKETLKRHRIAELDKDVEHNQKITQRYIEYAKNESAPNTKIIPKIPSTNKTRSKKISEDEVFFFIQNL
jgi:ribonuclease D